MIKSKSPVSNFFSQLFYSFVKDNIAATNAFNYRENFLR